MARLKSNRLLDGVAVRERWRYRFGRAGGRLRKVSYEVGGVEDGRRYFVTNDAQLTPREVKAAYPRQQIKETFRLLKKEFGWGGSGARKATAQVAHLSLRRFTGSRRQCRPFPVWVDPYQRQVAGAGLRREQAARVGRLHIAIPSLKLVVQGALHRRHRLKL